VRTRAALLAALLAAGCADGSSYVHVTATGNVGDIDELAVGITNAGQLASVTYAPGAPFQLPYDFALRFDKSRRGQLSIAVDARAAGHLIASGLVMTMIEPSHGTDVTVALEGQAPGNDLALGGSSDLAVAVADLAAPVDLLGVPPLFGDNTIEANTDPHAAGLADASNFVAPTSGIVPRLTVYYTAGNATELLIGLYDDSGNHPHNLLAHGTVSSPVAGQWNTAEISPVAVTQGATYWIALVAPVGHGTMFSFNYGTGAPGNTTTEHSTQSNLTTMPAVWSTGATFPGTFCSFYAGP
jgi:hypothetical protein